MSDIRAISACLLGVRCRYDGGHNEHPAALRRTATQCLIPICPEQLGGLPTPRVPAEIVGGDGHDVIAGRARVVDRDGRDITAAFVQGARESLALCKRLRIDTVWLKSHSPSCGVGEIHRGDALVPGDGVTAALLAGEGLTVLRHPD